MKINLKNLGMAMTHLGIVTNTPRAFWIVHGESQCLSRPTFQFKTCFGLRKSRENRGIVKCKF